MWASYKLRWVVGLVENKSLGLCGQYIVYDCGIVLINGILCPYRADNKLTDQTWAIHGLG